MPMHLTDAAALTVDQLHLASPSLNAIHWHLPAGKKLAIVGPNGAGKTTLLRCLTGHYALDAGQIRIDNTPIERLKRKQRAQQMALVSQHSDQDFGLLVRDILALARLPFGDKDPNNAIGQAVQTMALAELLDKPLAHLSGGERQRVMIGRALAQTPKLLLLDEPCNHLDISHQLKLIDSLKNLSCTVVTTLHDLNLASHFDYVLILNQGRQQIFAPAEEALHPDTIECVYEVRANAGRCPFHQTPHFAFALESSDDND